MSEPARYEESTTVSFLFLWGSHKLDPSNLRCGRMSKCPNSFGSKNHCFLPEPKLYHSEPYFVIEFDFRNIAFFEISTFGSFPTTFGKFPETFRRLLESFRKLSKITAFPETLAVSQSFRKLSIFPESFRKLSKKFWKSETFTSLCSTHIEKYQLKNHCGSCSIGAITHLHYSYQYIAKIFHLWQRPRHPLNF